MRTFLNNLPAKVSVAGLLWKPVQEGLPEQQRILSTGTHTVPSAARVTGRWGSREGWAGWVTTLGLRPGWVSVPKGREQPVVGWVLSVLLTPSKFLIK